MSAVACDRNQLARSCWRLAYDLASSFFHTHDGVPFDDFEAAALEALGRAAVKFDPSRGLKFTTVAYHYIQRELSRIIVKKNQLKNNCGKNPTLFTDYISTTIRDSQELQSDPIKVSDYRESSPHYQASCRELFTRYIGLCKTAREKDIILSYLNGQTFTEICKKYRVSKERPRQIFDVFIKRCKQHDRAKRKCFHSP